MQLSSPAFISDNFSTSSLISKPDIGASFMTIFKPLSSLGLWLPVIITPCLEDPTFVA